jgi:hypothetical protein
MSDVRESDIPLFASTEEAERFGRELRRVIAPNEFQTLVRVWLVTELAAKEAADPQAQVFLATRSGKLREAVQTFLFPDGMAPRPQHETAEVAEVGCS